MLTGNDFWPEVYAKRYRRAGYWRDESFWDMLCDGAENYGERIALVDGERRWSYRQLQCRAVSLAIGLHSIGIGPQQRVLIQLPNSLEFVVLCFALFRLGAIPVLALPAYRHSEISHLCNHSGAMAYVVASRHGRHDNLPMVSEVQRQCPELRHTIIVGGDVGVHLSFDNLYHGNTEANVLTKENVLTEENILTEANVLPTLPHADQVALFQLSGGTTGSPKLIPRTHADYAYSIRASAEICQFDTDTVYLAVLPVAHNFPLSSPGILGVLHAGGRIVFAQDGDPEQAFELIAREQVTVTALVPPLVLMWMDQVMELQPDLSSLRLLQVGGAKLSEEAARRVQPLLGCRLQQVFGMAEGLVCYTRSDDSELLVTSSQGRPISPDDEIRIVDDEDNALAPGSIGNLQTRGPYTIRSYFNAPEHNARAFTSDGFYRTGDLVRQLPSGHLVVEGRAKDLINRGGDKISAEEVENLLLGHPAIADVALVAMPDAFLGERSCAFVIARGLLPVLGDIKDFLRNRGVADFKLPDRLELLPSFPYTAVGKVSKQALRELIAAKLATEQGRAVSTTMGVEQDIHHRLRPHDVLTVLAGTIAGVVDSTEADAAAFQQLASFNGGGVYVGRLLGGTPWECHPDADELLYVLEGEVTVTFLTSAEPLQSAAKTVVQAGNVLVVPRGVWHRQCAVHGVALLAATPERSLISFEYDPRTDLSTPS